MNKAKKFEGKEKKPVETSKIKNEISQNKSEIQPQVNGDLQVNKKLNPLKIVF